MTSPDMQFVPSAALSMGVELELQIVNSRDYNLAHDAAHLLAVLKKMDHTGEVKPEITESMIELNSSVQTRHAEMVDELRAIRDTLASAAMRLNLRVAGGGSHPFHKWTQRRIFPTQRFEQLVDTYGYLAKQFTVFGQHVHIGCPDGDAAIYLTHMLSRYVPHFIALSASSPYQQGEDTRYQSSRLNTVSAFPLSGHMPFVQNWDGFVAFFEKMRSFRIAESMKDFYWDIRPKPEYGTVEIRVFDTPLTVERAALLAAFAQTLAHYFLSVRPLQLDPDVYLVYKYNRFQACRYGLEATFVDAQSQRRIPLQQDLLKVFETLREHAGVVGAAGALEALEADVRAGRSDAAWLRGEHQRLGSLNDVVRLQADEWMGHVLPVS
jgi:glutamate---cysteine ligase / carboxylate-amine ligase